jgi:hypothetical protein
LYSISPGSGAYPQPISRDALPEELIDIDTSENTVIMCYDGHHGGVHLNVTPVDGSTGTHWWIQLSGQSGNSEKGYWPVVLSDLHQPTSMLSYAADPSSENRVFLGCTDGYIREYDDETVTDDGVAFDSFVFVGPIRMGGDDYKQGMIAEILGTTAENSDDVAWSIYAAKGCEEVCNESYPKCSGSWQGGRSRNSHPRVSGGAMMLKVSSGGRWALERVTADIRPRGKQRL